MLDCGNSDLDKDINKIMPKLYMLTGFANAATALIISKYLADKKNEKQCEMQSEIGKLTMVICLTILTVLSIADLLYILKNIKKHIKGNSNKW